MPTTVSGDDLKTLTAMLREYRDRTGSNNTQIAEAAGVRRATVSELLSGTYKHSPTFDVVKRLCDVAGLQIRFDRSH